MPKKNIFSIVTEPKNRDMRQVPLPHIICSNGTCLVSLLWRNKRHTQRKRWLSARRLSHIERVVHALNRGIAHGSLHRRPFFTHERSEGPDQAEHSSQIEGNVQAKHERTGNLVGEEALAQQLRLAGGRQLM